MKLITTGLNPITIIHGPPGTGKTTALAAVIISAVANGSKVLATAPSHAAVDALTLAIVKQWDEDILNISLSKLLRIGNVLRLKDPRTKNYLPKTSPQTQSYCEDLEHLRVDLLKETKGKKLLLESEQKLINQIRHTSTKSDFDQISNSHIVISTCLTALNWPKHIHRMFDLICIDEAAFAPDWLIVPLALSGIPKLVMSGDHFQLPPVIVSDSINNTSLMENLIHKVPTATLTQQFRSNEIISKWSSRHFYENKLHAHSSVKSITLNDLVQTKNSNLENPLLFIDTSGQNFDESEDAEGVSISNYNEAFVVELVVRKYIKLGIPTKDIGVITPYWSQVGTVAEILRGQNHFSR